MPNIYLDSMYQSYPNFRDCTIQLFDDNKERHDWSLAKKVDQRNFDKDTLDKALTYYNNQWAWIFFSVNSMEHCENKKDGFRDVEHVTHINAWICECDDKTKEEQEKLFKSCPLYPSLVIESNKSFHMYWFAKDGTKEKRKDICRWLCNYFWWDKKVIDLSRVLRVPWYNHMKNPDEPFECAIYDWNGEYYSEDEMLQAFPDTMSDTDKQEEKRRLEEHKKRMAKLDKDDTRYRINAMDSMQMLEEISWSSMVSGETFSFKRNSKWYQIIVNWKESWCWIDRNWLIWSSDKGGPTWVNWVLWYGVYDEKDIYQWVKEHHPEILPEKKTEETKNIDSILSAINEDMNAELHTYYYPKWFEKFNSFLSGELVTIVAPSNSWKTTFAMDIIKRNTAEWRKCFYINGEFRIETVWVNRRLWAHWKTKEALWDKNPLTPEEKKDMEKYVSDSLWQFWYDCSPMGYKLDELVELITEKTKEWYELFVIDSLSKIQGNLTQEARSHQNQTMETFLALVQKLNIAVILLHHTNKFWKFEGSQKIFDFSNVFITMAKNDDPFVWIPSRTFKLEKDKYVNDVELEMYYDIKTGTYTESLSEAAEMRKNNFNS